MMCLILYHATVATLLAYPLYRLSQNVTTESTDSESESETKKDHESGSESEDDIDSMIDMVREFTREVLGVDEAAKSLISTVKIDNDKLTRDTDAFFGFLDKITPGLESLVGAENLQRLRPKSQDITDAFAELAKFNAEQLTKLADQAAKSIITTLDNAQESLSGEVTDLLNQALVDTNKM